jgi:hypothetical protein
MLKKRGRTGTNRTAKKAFLSQVMPIEVYNIQLSDIRIS